MITIVLLILNVGFSIYAMERPDVKFKYIFHPYSIFHFKQHYRFLSHAFLHADYMHLAFNMFALWTFGMTVEKAIMPILAGSFEHPNKLLGSLYYVLLYTGGIYASSITEYFKNKNNQYYTSLGASGAVNAVIFSFILCLPRETMGLFFIPLPIPAWIFGLLFLGVSYFLSKRQQRGQSLDNIGHEAHFWGAIYGLVFTAVVGLMNKDVFFSILERSFK
jgi:membrane associated rhomboid family serine protease